MELKDRKLIQNVGFTPPSMNSIVNDAGSFNFGNALSVPSTREMLMADTIAKNNAITNSLPSFTKSGGVGSFLKNNAGGIMNTAASALNFTNTLGNVSKNNYSSDEMMGSGGTVQQNANSVGYTEQRVDEAGIQKQIDATAGAATMSGITSGMSLGASAGSLLGPIGGVVGGAAGALIGGIAGFFGGSKAKEEAERQKRIAINRTIAANTQNREAAYTIGLRNEFNRNNRTDESQSLFHAAKGKEGDVNPLTMQTYKKHVVNTAYGKMYAPQNAWVSDGEVIKSADGSLHRVKGGKNDTARAYLQTGDSVYSNNIINPETGNTIADDAASYAMAGQLDRLDMNQNVGRMMQYTGKRKGNVLPGYLGGTNKIWNTVKNIGSNLDWENIIPTATAFASAAQRDAQAEGGLRAPKSFVANPYENAALDELNKLHSDYYTVWAGNREAEGRAKSTIAQSGGLSAGQRMLAYMGMLNQTQQNNANAMFDAQRLNNEYRGQAAKIKLATGENSATRQSEAYRWDEDMLAKANAARLNMWETSAYDRQNALESFFHNRFKKQQFDRTMNLYESQQKDDAAKTKAIIDSLYNNNKPSKVAKYTPTLKDVASTATTAKGMRSIHPSLMSLPTMQNVDFSNLIKALAVQKPAKRKTTKRGGAR